LFTAQSLIWIDHKQLPSDRGFANAKQALDWFGSRRLRHAGPVADLPILDHTSSELIDPEVSQFKIAV
jgi:hypothetical protein